MNFTEVFWALTKFQLTFSFNYDFALSLQFLCSAGHRSKNIEISPLTYWAFLSQCQSLNKVRFLLYKKGHACYNPKQPHMKNRKLRQLRAEGEEGGYVKNPNQIYACTFYFCKGSGPGVIQWERENPLCFLETYFSFCDYKERHESRTRREIKRILNVLSALKVMVFSKHVAQIFGWASFANSHRDIKTSKGTTAQRSKGSFCQSPFTYLNINSPSL